MAEQVVLPDDQEFFKLNEVCKVANVQPYMLRFWGTEFAQLEAAKSGTGQRLYTKEQVQVILEIRRLLFDEGLTIAGARKRVGAMQKDGALPVPEVPALADEIPPESGKEPAKPSAEPAAKTEKPAKEKKTAAKKPAAKTAGGAADSGPAPEKASEPKPAPVAAVPSPADIEKAAAKRVQPLLSTLKDVRKEVANIMKDLKPEA